jgi:aspartate/tyrosine/aromatic aminotransferase
VDSVCFVPWHALISLLTCSTPALKTVQYSKNFGLYGERIGALNVITKDASVVPKIRSQLNGYAAYLA